jgi:hypothetical protein
MSVAIAVAPISKLLRMIFIVSLPFVVDFWRFASSFI